MSSAWVEVAEDAWYQRFDPWDVNVGVVRGGDGLCIIDTRGSDRQAQQLLDELRVFGAPVRAAVNTHWHFDHTWGNATLARAGADLWGHVTLPDTMTSWFDDVRASLGFADPSVVDELGEVECTPPDHLVDPVGLVDLGDRGVEVRFLGQGHTDGDVIATSTATSAVFAGDLVEQAGPPAYGDDSNPLAWPETCARLLDRLDGDSVVVPGHGVAVDHEFCRDQQRSLSTIADVLRDLHAAGIPAKDALREGADRWPIAAERLSEAVLRAYADLGPS